MIIGDYAESDRKAIPIVLLTCHDWHVPPLPAREKPHRYNRKRCKVLSYYEQQERECRSNEKANHNF